MSVLPRSMSLYITFECNECGEELETGYSDFHDAVELLKAEGWRFRKDDETGEWMHYCPGCKK